MNVPFIPRRAACLPAMLSLVLALGGCQSRNLMVGQHATPAPVYAAEQAAAGQPIDSRTVEDGQLSYELQPGDQIDVKFYYHAELNESLVIGPDHLIAMQLIGEVDVSGMSAGALAEELTRRYARTLRNPQATVLLRKFALPRIYVAGEVAQPSAHALEGGHLTALQAIVQSGGFRVGAERGNVIVLRNSGGGKPVFIKLDLQGHLEQTVQADLLLRPYDIVYVPQKQIAEVAEFFDEYFNKIVPIYRNLGFSFFYNVRGSVDTGGTR